MTGPSENEPGENQSGAMDGISASAYEPPDPDLSGRIIHGLEGLIWNAQESESPGGVSRLDRVEAVQLLGQFSDPLAGQVLIRLVREAPQKLQPRLLGRWVRDTALETLIDSPLQDRAYVNRLLRSYYNLGTRLLRFRPERNLVYDDIPLLVSRGRAGPILISYLLPLVVLLLAWVLASEGVAALNNALRSYGRPGNVIGIQLAGWLFFGATGLAVFSIDQVVLVLLVAALGPWLPLPRIRTLLAKGILATVLTLVTVALSIWTLLQVESLREWTDEKAQMVVLLLYALPLLVLPCYMLAHDFETGASEIRSGGRTRGPVLLAVALRLASGFCYIVFVLAAFGYTFIRQNLFFSGASVPSDWEVFVAMLPWLGYLLVAPLPVLALLSLIGWLQGLFSRPRAASASRS